jgi:hypothetical protein
MAKNMVVALLLGVAFIGALFAVMSWLKKKEAVRYDTSYAWHVESDPGSGTDMLVRGRKINEVKNDVNTLIMALNKYGEGSEANRTRPDGSKDEYPKITLRKIEQQTAHIEIVNDQFLTENMGSSGAQDYLAVVTYTLTENTRIKAVNFIFQAGEHAMPGRYSREDFTNYKIVTKDNRR